MEPPFYSINEGLFTLFCNENDKNVPPKTIFGAFKKDVIQLETQVAMAPNLIAQKSIIELSGLFAFCLILCLQTKKQKNGRNKIKTTQTHTNTHTQIKQSVNEMFDSSVIVRVW